jgi:hypothetical protein
VMVDEIRLRAHARPLDEPGQRRVSRRGHWVAIGPERTSPGFPGTPGGRSAPDGALVVG